VLAWFLGCRAFWGLLGVSAGLGVVGGGGRVSGGGSPGGFVGDGGGGFRRFWSGGPFGGAVRGWFVVGYGGGWVMGGRSCGGMFWGVFHARGAACSDGWGSSFGEGFGCVMGVGFRGFGAGGGIHGWCGWGCFVRGLFRGSGEVPGGGSLRGGAGVVWGGVGGGIAGGAVGSFLF